MKYKKKIDVFILLLISHKMCDICYEVNSKEKNEE